MVDVGAVLDQIRSGTAPRKLESDQLEFKAQSPDRRADLDLAEAAVCFANARGGTVFVGVRDSPGGPDAFVGTDLDAAMIRSRIYELTDPHLPVEVSDYTYDGNRLLRIRIAEGMDVHSTANGRMSRRSGDQCVPLSAQEAARLVEDRRGADWSALSSQVTLDAISARTLGEVRDLLALSSRPALRSLADAGVRDLLAGAGLLADGGRLTNAAVIALAGDPTGPVRIVYQHRRTSGAESTTVLRAGGPLVTGVRSVLDAIALRQESTPLNLPGGQQIAIEDYPTNTVREALLNAVVHGDLRTGEAVQVDHSPRGLVITSPGPLVAGVTPQNILTRGPKARFKALNDLFLTLGLVEHVGAGVKRMYREMLRSGRDAPTIDDEGDRVVVTLLGQRADVRVARFARGLPDDAGNDIDTLLVLNELCRHKTVTASTVAPVIQRDVDQAQRELRRLSAEPVSLVEPTAGTMNRRRPNYRLTSDVLAQLGSAVEYHRTDPSAVERAVVDHVRDFGWVNNAMVQRTFDIDVYRASRLLSELVDRNLLVRSSAQTRGTAVAYRPGPAFPPSAARRRSPPESSS